MKKKVKRKGFPIGIFLILLIIQLLLSAAVSSLYFYYTAKKRTDEIVKDTRNYSIKMVEAFAHSAALLYRAKNYKKLKSLFQEKIEETYVEEAFFVLASGKIIIHSDKKATQLLKGNIATDEFAYNIDIILLPIKKDSGKTLFTDYNIISKKVPFDKDQRRLLKKYLYKKINITGWLASRAIFKKNKPIGTVNFILSKQRIYDLLFSLIDESIKLLAILSAVSLIISLFISVITHIRYRSLSRLSFTGIPALEEGKFAISKEAKDEVVHDDTSDIEEIVTDLPEDEFIIQEIDSGSGYGEKIYQDEQSTETMKRSEKAVKRVFAENEKFDTSRVIKDAIPVKKR